MTYVDDAFEKLQGHPGDHRTEQRPRQRRHRDIRDHIRAELGARGRLPDRQLQPRNQDQAVEGRRHLRRRRSPTAPRRTCASTAPSRVLESSGGARRALPGGHGRRLRMQRRDSALRTRSPPSTSYRRSSASGGGYEIPDADRRAGSRPTPRSTPSRAPPRTTTCDGKFVPLREDDQGHEPRVGRADQPLVPARGDGPGLVRAPFGRYQDEVTLVPGQRRRAGRQRLARPRRDRARRQRHHGRLRPPRPARALGELARIADAAIRLEDDGRSAQRSRSGGGCSARGCRVRDRHVDRQAPESARGPASRQGVPAALRPRAPLARAQARGGSGARHRRRVARADRAGRPATTSPPSPPHGSSSAAPSCSPRNERRTGRRCARARGVRRRRLRPAMEHRQGRSPARPPRTCATGAMRQAETEVRDWYPDVRPASSTRSTCCSVSARASPGRARTTEPTRRFSAGVSAWRSCSPWRSV